MNPIYKTKHSSLLNAEGWYDTEPFLPEFFPEFVHKLFDDWKKEQREKFTKYLSNRGVNNRIVSEAGKNLKTTSFKISCRFNDFKRCGNSKHYKSCYGEHECYNSMTHVMANDPNVAIVYVPDKSGDFLLRSFVRLVQQEDGTQALVLIKWYGNGPKQAIEAKLNEILPLLIGDNKGGRILYSPVKSSLRVKGFDKEIRVFNDIKMNKTKRGRLGIRVA